jgi:iron(III) transport system substrate-binding protein
MSTRFRLRTATLLAAVLLVLAGCGSARSGADAEKRLTLYTSFSADLYNVIAAEFEQKTGIKVDIVTGGTGVMMKRIESEAANPLGDVMLGGGAEAFEAIRQHFEPYTVRDDAQIPTAFKSPTRHWYGYNALPMVFIYNKNLVKESEAPQGWQDLTDPRWKGRIAMADLTKSGTSFIQTVTMLQLFGREDGKGWAVVSAVVRNARILDSSQLPLKGTNDGEYAVGITYEQGAYKYMKGGGPVGLIYPAEGTASVPDGVAIIKGAKHPKNARLFLDWMLSKEGQALAAKLALRPVRADVAPPEGLLSIDQIKVIPYDIGWAAANKAQIQERWKALITQQ